jgi:predicted unusual protein kinase regulating ubiquinone biosynthesis (AarF/ABC1/UbiB family)
MNKSIKGIFFILNVFFIFTTEMLLYALIRDYSYFIDRLTMRLSKINILYVKVFQAFALNNSLIDDKTNNELIKFTDNVPWDYSDINFYDLIEMTDKYNILLKGDYELPINSGMISLVFKGYMNDNPVIIKMKRKNIDEKLNDAINNLSFCLYILSFIPILHKYQIVEVINKNIEVISHQTNFLEEVCNMELMKNNCKNLKYVIIPEAIKNITQEYPNIIVMNFIDGMKINEIKEDDRECFAKQVIKFGIVTLAVHGVSHGDLHSGNILFIKDEKDLKYPFKIGVIDFGIIYKLNNENKNSVFDVVTQMFELKPREIAEKVLNSGAVEPNGILKQLPKQHYNNIISFAEEIIDEVIKSSKKVNQIHIYRFITKLKDYLLNDELSRIGIRPSDSFIKLQMVIAMAHGVTFTLSKDNYVQLVDTCINEIFNLNIILDD